MKKTHEHHKRSIAKAITWRVIASLTTMTLVYMFTGEVTLSLEIGAFDIILKMFFYYLHERGWNSVHWGRS